MAKSQTARITTYSLNQRAFEAKEARRYEKARYAPERKMEIVEKLRDTARDLRLNSVVVKRGEVVRLPTVR
jgi:hypothetical protein